MQSYGSYPNSLYTTRLLRRTGKGITAKMGNQWIGKFVEMLNFNLSSGLPQNHDQDDAPEVVEAEVA